MTPRVKAYMLCGKDDPFPKTQVDEFAMLWEKFQASCYGVFVQQPGEPATQHTRRLGPLFTEVCAPFYSHFRS
jgi:hypothetical protein